MGRTEGDEELLERQDLADDPCTVHAIVASVRRLQTANLVSGEWPIR